MAAGIATVETMVADKLPERAAELGDYFMAELNAKLVGNPLVKQIRGKGLLIGIECTLPASELIPSIHHAGLLVTAAGPNVLRLLPNLLVTREEADQGIGIIAAVLAEKAAASVK
jgi:acetylornithine aminotransferase